MTFLLADIRSHACLSAVPVVRSILCQQAPIAPCLRIDAQSATSTMHSSLMVSSMPLNFVLMTLAIPLLYRVSLPRFISGMNEDGFWLTRRRIGCLAFFPRFAFCTTQYFMNASILWAIEFALLVPESYSR